MKKHNVFSRKLENPAVTVPTTKRLCFWAWQTSSLDHLDKARKSSSGKPKLESPHQGSHTVKSSCRAAKLKSPHIGQPSLKVLILGSKTEKSYIRATKLNILILRARLKSPQAVELINPKEARLIIPEAAVLINPKAARLEDPRAACLESPKVAMHSGHLVDAVALVEALQGDHLHRVQVEVVEGEEVHEQVPDVGLHHGDSQVHHLVSKPVPGLCRSHDLSCAHLSWQSSVLLVFEL